MRAVLGRWDAALAAVLAVSSAATVGALRRTSTTFDEIVLVAGGARGYRTGLFDLAPDHPPLMQYLYGLPVYLDGPAYPEESGKRWGSPTRYVYAREFFFGRGNDPERLSLLSRIVAAALAGALTLTVYAFCRRTLDAPTAVLAASLVAFLPDVLAHGGVAYNDVPVALAFFGALWAIHTAVSEPSWLRGALAGALAAVGMAVKFTGGLLLPAAALLVLAEGARRRGDASWRRRLLAAGGAGALAAFGVLVAVYRGDWTLEELRLGLGVKLLQAGAESNSPAYLLGRSSASGFWYYFPAAFLLKTPVAFHLLACLAVAGRIPRRGSPPPPALRAVALGAAVLAVALLATRKNIGFRYALPVLPLLAVLVAAGARRFAARGWWAAAVVAALSLAHAGSALRAYPHFLAYLSEYAPAPERGYEYLADSSLDWGQGLVALREFLREEGIPRVYLSYFGSALPESYGIEYAALPSYFPLARGSLPPGATPPAHVAISATNLTGLYLPGDPFARFRRVRPYRVVGGAIFVYRLADEWRGAAGPRTTVPGLDTGRPRR